MGPSLPQHGSSVPHPGRGPHSGPQPHLPDVGLEPALLFHLPPGQATQVGELAGPDSLPPGPPAKLMWLQFALVGQRKSGHWSLSLPLVGKPRPREVESAGD